MLPSRRHQLGLSLVDGKAWHGMHGMPWMDGIRCWTMDVWLCSVGASVAPVHGKAVGQAANSVHPMDGIVAQVHYAFTYIISHCARDSKGEGHGSFGWFSGFVFSARCLMPRASPSSVLTVPPAIGVTMSIGERLRTEGRRAQASTTMHIRTTMYIPLRIKHIHGSDTYATYL
ncbi:hypothetical protein LZ31DRAFT_124355 [Colletotrichum somersetense]|nr:hypothetical protein LZ31DRAFT_124355 [Colletotrichum somersetense]